MGIIDKLTGHPSADTTHGKHSHESTTTAPAFGQDSTLQSSTQAPIVQERTHDQYKNINNTDTTTVKDKTEVQQTTQPIYDKKTEGVQRDRVDHGTEIHEHGHGGIDRRTEQELSHNREKLAREYHDSHDLSTRTTAGGHTHDTEYRTNKVEEVIPVIQKDVYRPHETEHTKKIVDVHHEQAKLDTHTNAPMSLEDWQKQGNSADTYKNREGYGTTANTSNTVAVPATTGAAYVEDPTANGEGFTNKDAQSGTTNLLTGHHHGVGLKEKVKGVVSGGDRNDNSGSAQYVERK